MYVKKSFDDFSSWGNVVSCFWVLVGVDFDIRMGVIVVVKLIVSLIMIWLRMSMFIVGVYSISIVVVEYKSFDIKSINLWFIWFVVGLVMIILVVVLKKVEVIIKFFKVGVDLRWNLGFRYRSVFVILIIIWVIGVWICCWVLIFLILVIKVERRFCKMCRRYWENNLKWNLNLWYVRVFIEIMNLL